MILAYLLLLTGLTISSVAIYYSVVGLTAIFSAAAVPIMIMGVSLEVAKLVCATWIKQYWTRVPRLMKTYMVTAVTVLMLITSMGIFGFLSKAHNDQNLVSGDVQSKIAIYDEKIRTARENIEADRKQLSQMDAAVDQVMSRSTTEGGADKANAIRRGQARERATVQRDIETNQRLIAQLNDEAAPIRAEVRKVDAEVGPIKYIAAFLYGTTPDASMLERAVTWIIIMIVIVFDPLAVIMLLASQMTFGWSREQKENKPETKTAFEAVRDPDSGEWIQTGPEFEYEVPAELTDEQIEAINRMLAEYAEPVPEPEVPEVEEPAEEEHPFRGRGLQPSIPMMPSYIQPNIADDSSKESIQEAPVLITRIAVPESNVDLQVTAESTPTSPPVNREAAPARGRGVMHTHLALADNGPITGRPSGTGFGNEFPGNPQKGDVYLRVDYLPNRLFKFNGNKWIEVDKESTDVYAYEEEYIKHLVDEIDAGRYDPDTLTDVEREQIRQFLEKNS